MASLTVIQLKNTGLFKCDSSNRLLKCIKCFWKESLVSVLCNDYVLHHRKVLYQTTCFCTSSHQKSNWELLTLSYFLFHTGILHSGQPYAGSKLSGQLVSHKVSKDMAMRGWKSSNILSASLISSLGGSVSEGLYSFSPLITRRNSVVLSGHWNTPCNSPL